MGLEAPSRAKGTKMKEYILRRFFHSVLVMVIVAIVSFGIIELPPGDILSSVRENLESQNVPQEVIESTLQMYRDRYGLDDKLYVRFWNWFTQLLRGDLGYSMRLNKANSELIGDRLLMTMIVSIITLITSMLIAIPIGIYSAIKQYSIGDYIFTVIAFIGMATPGFLLCLVYIFIAVAVFEVKSVAGLFSPEYVFAPWSWGKVMDLLQHIWAVVIIIGVSGAAGTIRVMRTKMLDALGEPFIDTARMKGLSNGKIYAKHALRVAINPIISSIGMRFPDIISGSTIVAIVLTLPMIGPLLVSSLMAADMYLACTILLLLTFALVVGNFLADLALAWLDPRIRYE
jgi:peptide/nickel transport system permease protein